MKKSVQCPLNSGFNSPIVEVECNITNGLPSLMIVGLPSKSIEEAKERVRSAFINSQLQFPRKRITINLAPADMPKSSTAFDLAISVAILIANKQVSRLPKNTAIVGELGLDGSTRPVRGIIGSLVSGVQNGIRTFFVPEGNVKQAQLVPDVEIIPVKNLKQLYLHLSGAIKINPISTDEHKTRDEYSLDTEIKENDFFHIAGQKRAKRALEIAAAGGHNILLNGPPGTGKSMLAKALVGVLPPLSNEEMIDVTHIHSLSGESYAKIVASRPFRSPHHTASQTSVIGGGSNPKPGEISLSHRGVLFLDELPEYSRATLEAMRQPLEDRVVTVARARERISYPANFMLVATSNPCPCGYFGSDKNCSCSTHEINRYKKKLSGPIMDRIDLYIDVDTINHKRLLENSKNEEPSYEIQKRVMVARQKQSARYNTASTNATLSNSQIKKLAKLSGAAKELIDKAATSLDISARSYIRTVKVARTIADLDNAEEINVEHISEALQYRKKSEL